jgi:hypothetical protein
MVSCPGDDMAAAKMRLGGAEAEVRLAEVEDEKVFPSRWSDL